MSLIIGHIAVINTRSPFMQFQRIQEQRSVFKNQQKLEFSPVPPFLQKHVSQTLWTKEDLDLRKAIENVIRLHLEQTRQNSYLDVLHQRVVQTVQHSVQKQLKKAFRKEDKANLQRFRTRLEQNYIARLEQQQSDALKRFIERQHQQQRREQSVLYNYKLRQNNTEYSKALKERSVCLNRLKKLSIERQKKRGKERLNAAKSTGLRNICLLKLKQYQRKEVDHYELRQACKEEKQLLDRLLTLYREELSLKRVMQAAGRADPPPLGSGRTMNRISLDSIAAFARPTFN